MRSVAALRQQAESCRALGSTMYGDLLEGLARDVESGGPVADLLAPHDDDAGPSALGLRLLGSLHRLVLERRAGSLALFYPSVGGTWERREGVEAALRLVAEDPTAVAEWLGRAPQTNEVGRAVALMGGLLQLDGGLPVRLCELGASGGLNLRVDRYGYTDGDGNVSGDPSSPLVFEGAWRGKALPAGRGPRIVERVGCDLAPVDPTSEPGRLTLTAYTWPDQRLRLERLRSALALAPRTPVELRRQDAAGFVRDLELIEGTTTVVWHSVMWQYLDRAEQDAVTDRLERLGGQATATRRLARILLEPTRRTPDRDHEFLVVMREWPVADGAPEGPVVLGHCAPHGPPVVWEGP